MTLPPHESGSAHSRWVLPGLLLIMASAACGPSTGYAADSSTVTVTDDRGRVVAFARSPRRIVSLLPPLTELVCALDACARLVGTDRYSNWPAPAASLPKLGGLEDAEIENIGALHPDVVLTGTSSRAIDRLEELGIPVVALEPKTLADTHRVLTVLARLIGASNGEDLWRRIDSRIAAAASQLPARFRGQRVYFEVSEAPYAAGASSFIGEILARLGLGNVVPAELGPFPRLNPEFVVRAQPDLIMASARELKDMQSRPGWGRLAALRTGRTCGFSEESNDTFMRAGPRLGEAADAIIACLERLPSAGSH